MKKDMLLGAICGDIAGSTREYYGMSENDTEFFPKGSTFTDDTILTVAVADAIMSDVPFAEAIIAYANLYPRPMGGYGCSFEDWMIQGELSGQVPPPYNSYGNGSAMRVCACAYAKDTLEEVIALARKSAECTHNHPEGTKGAEATAAAIFLARNGASKEEIREYIHANYYDMSRSLEDLLNVSRHFGELCQNTVPEAILSFLYSTDYKSAVILSMQTNEDCDTAGAICGAIAGAYYGVPQDVKDKAYELLDVHLLDVIEEFEREVVKDSKS